MEYIIAYICLFSIIVLIGQIFNNTMIPSSLILVLAGMAISFVPSFPIIQLNPHIVLNIFLPLMLYQISAFSSWRDIKINMRPILLLSIGHVVFITLVVAYVIHYLIPDFGWPLAFVLGAVISPPDDVAIIAIAEKIRMPKRVVTILKGEGMFNDAAALIIFRLALAALVSTEFSAMHALSVTFTFFAIIISEVVYGLIVGYVLGEIRTRIRNPILHIIASFITPFIAYIPAVACGGCGVLATAVSGFVIGNNYSLRFTAEFRLISRAVWPTITYAMESILYLLMGMSMLRIVNSISAIPLHLIIFYSSIMIFIVIVGRFFWMCIAVLTPRLIPSVRKRDPLPPWQYVFLGSWAGMRGNISLAAALAVPMIPMTLQNNVNPRDLLIYLVFCVIITTLIVQGLTLPWVLKVIDGRKFGEQEHFNEHIEEINSRISMNKAAIAWLKKFKIECLNDTKSVEEIDLRIIELRTLIEKLELKLIYQGNKSSEFSDHRSLRKEAYLSIQINSIERKELLNLWHENKISISLRNKLLDRLDHQRQHLKT